LMASNFVQPTIVLVTTLIDDIDVTNL
jgi:hypothetical protein